MKKVWPFAACLSLALPLGQQAAALEPNPGTPGVVPPGAAAAQAPATTARIIVKYRDNAQARAATTLAAESSAVALGQRAGVSLQHLRVMGGNAQIVALPAPLSEDEVRAIAGRIAQDPDVEYAEPDAIMTIQQVNDPRFAEQWHYTQAGVGINLSPAWNHATGQRVVVAVIDTGVRPHADLAANILPGHDFIADVDTANDGDGRDADASDPGDPCAPRNSTWHGTHVAGTIAAITNNGADVAGVARNARILPVRVLGRCGGFLSDIADGMRWSAGLSVPGVPDNANPAQVLNLSLGGGGACGPTYADAISAIRARGATVVVAAGNSQSNASGFRPANCDGVVTVAATNREGGRAFYSNFGGSVEIAAPGGETDVAAANGVLSTLNTGTAGPGADSLAFYQGTSMAAPHVAGVVALLYEANPAITPDEVVGVLQRAAQPFPAASTRPCDAASCGAGIVNAAAAVDEAISALGGFIVQNRPVADFATWAASSVVRVLTGDFNGDGKADIALVRTEPGWGSVPVALSGDSGFDIQNRPVGDFAGWAASSVVRAVTGDFNGDGRTDIALVRQEPGWGSVPVALSSPTGFDIQNRPVGDFATWAATPGVQVVAGDFNGDGRTDLALVRQEPGWGSVPVALSSATGFDIQNRLVGEFAGWAASSVVRVLTGDFNGDGKADIALVRAEPGWGSVPVALSGDSGFDIQNRPVDDFAAWAASSVVRVLTGDFNGDGRTDIALVRQEAGWNTVPVALSSPTGFDIQNRPVGDYAAWAASSVVRELAGDFNGDGRSDLALVRQGVGWQTLPLAFSSAGAFDIRNPPVGHFAGWAGSSVVRVLTGDFNGDGRSDIALVRQESGWSTVPVALSR